MRTHATIIKKEISEATGLSKNKMKIGWGKGTGSSWLHVFILGNPYWNDVRLHPECAIEEQVNKYVRVQKLFFKYIRNGNNEGYPYNSGR